MGNINELFYNYLESNNALDKYLSNVTGPYAQLDYWTKARSIIDYSFTWSETPQGESYWFNLHNEWEEITYERRISEEKVNIGDVVSYLQVNGDLWTD